MHTTAQGMANVQSSIVSVVDLGNHEVVTTLHLPKRAEAGAHGIAYIPAA